MSCGSSVRSVESPIRRRSGAVLERGRRYPQAHRRVLSRPRKRRTCWGSRHSTDGPGLTVALQEGHGQGTEYPTNGGLGDRQPCLSRLGTSWSDSTFDLQRAGYRGSPGRDMVWALPDSSSPLAGRIGGDQPPVPRLALRAADENGDVGILAAWLGWGHGGPWRGSGNGSA